jgi:hypothetical protein
MPAVHRFEGRPGVSRTVEIDAKPAPLYGGSVVYEKESRLLRR